MVLAVRDFAVVELFHALDGFKWEGGDSHTKGSVWVQSDGR